MRLIKVTSFQTKNPIYINIDMIGSISTTETHSRIGVTTHNNGGFQVTESVDKILKLIKESKGI